MSRPRIIILGNAPALTRGPFHNWLDPDAVAGFIDESDIVVRINYAPHRDRRDAGTRTDILAVMSSPRTRSRDRLPADLVNRAREIWLLRPDARIRPALPPDQAWREGRWRATAVDEMADFQGFADRPMIAIDDDRHHDLAASLRAPGAPMLPPSAGMVAIEMALADPRFAGHDVYIAGFWFQGWYGHPLAAEAARIRGYVAAGRLKTLSDAGLPRNPGWNAADWVLSIPRVWRFRARRAYVRLMDPRGRISGGYLK